MTPMNDSTERPSTRVFFALLALSVLALPACSSGGSSPPAVCVEYMAAAGPAASTVSTADNAASNCSTARVDVVLSDVTDVLQVNFDVVYDSSQVNYQSVSTAGSFLRSDGNAIQVVITPQAGRVKVGLTRVNTGIDFTGNQVVAQLNFARRATSGSSALTLDNGQVFGSEAPPVEKNGIGWSGGTFVIR